jgi:hypothetical protein
MQSNNPLLEQLKAVLHRKKNNEYYANVLGVSEEEIAWAREQLKKDNITGHSTSKERKETQEEEEGDYQDSSYQFTESPGSGTATITASFPEECRTLDELIEKCDIDTEKWVITKYVQNYWGNKNNPHWQVKAWLQDKATAVPGNQVLQERFMEFISTYSSPHVAIKWEKPVQQFPKAGLLIPKQDFHFDKLDVGGDNDFFSRQSKDYSSTAHFISQASRLFELSEVYYVLGSDYFNSEYTKTTTKGTPQQNAVASYHQSFNYACIHEMEMIRYILDKAGKVKVIFIAGNHDYYVGWHLVQWLAAYFRDDPRVEIDATPDLRKYIQYADTAVMLNHGNDVKPQTLANIFPSEYKHGWSSANHFYIITGDKHQEKSADFGAIRHYQVPALSSAKSLWDQNNGYVVTRTEHSGFIMEENKGISLLLREPSK